MWRDVLEGTPVNTDRISVHVIDRDEENVWSIGGSERDNDGNEQEEEVIAKHLCRFGLLLYQKVVSNKPKGTYNYL